MALDEALCLGVPSVASFAGAMTELGRHKETVYYFQSADFVMCANAIDDIFTDSLFASEMSNKTLSANSYNMDNNHKAQLQFDIYKNILNNVDNNI